MIELTWNHEGTLYLKHGRCVGRYRRFGSDKWHWWLFGMAQNAHDAHSRDECIARLEEAAASATEEER